MRGLVSLLGVVLAAGCQRKGARPSEPTLSVSPEAGKEGDRRIVAAAKIAQPWHVGSWSPASITLADVAAGDSIVVLGVYWGALESKGQTTPTADRTALTSIVDHASSVVGLVKPPVFAQIYAALTPAPGKHVIVPPYLGGGAGDGTFYVLQIRGLTEHRVISTSQVRRTGLALPEIEVGLERISPGDLAIAIGGYDNTKPIDNAGWVHPPGWTTIDAQDDAATNVPSSLVSRLGPISAAPKWSWSDPTVNVATALVVVLR